MLEQFMNCPYEKVKIRSKASIVFVIKRAEEEVAKTPAGIIIPDTAKESLKLAKL
jgi:hypothetical protein